MMTTSTCSMEVEDESSENIDHALQSTSVPARVEVGCEVKAQNWCSIHYYELKNRVGGSYEALVPSITVDGFCHPSRADRLCLGSFSNVNRTIEVEKTRNFIGNGLKMVNKDGNLTVECESDAPIFVQTPNMSIAQGVHPATVYRIAFRCKLCVFRMADFAHQLSCAKQNGVEAVNALVSICSLRISFVKGWGLQYRRQAITSTPCWIEVHLNEPLQMLDHELSRMPPSRQPCSSMS